MVMARRIPGGLETQALAAQALAAEALAAEALATEALATQALATEGLATLAWEEVVLGPLDRTTMDLAAAFPMRRSSLASRSVIMTDRRW